MRKRVSYVVFGVSVLPLLLLSVGAFLGDESIAGSRLYEPVDFASFDAVRTAAANALRAATGAMPTAVDPAGFSANGPNDQVVVAIALPYEVAEHLSQAQQDLTSLDGTVVRQTKKSLQIFADDRLAAVKKLQPHGDKLAAAISRRLESLALHEIWISNRARVRESISRAAAAVQDGPEITGEKKCLAELSQLKTELPKIVARDSVHSEPGDAMTVDEDREYELLLSRARFRGKYFTLRAKTHANSLTSVEIKLNLDAWEAFLTTYPKGSPDDRDAAYIPIAKNLQHKTQLSWLRAVAMEQKTARGLVLKTAEWLKHANKSSAEDVLQQKAAVELVQSWLNKNVPAVPRCPPELAVLGLQEGFTDPADKRKFGFFKKVAQTPAQFRWWSKSDLIATEGKGENSFNLKGIPVQPRYIVFRNDFEKCRIAFTTDGFRTFAGAETFRDECVSIQSKYLAYREAYAEPESLIDASVTDWGNSFKKAQDIAEQIMLEGNHSGLWKLMALSPSSL